MRRSTYMERLLLKRRWWASKAATKKAKARLKKWYVSRVGGCAEGVRRVRGLRTHSLGISIPSEGCAPGIWLELEKQMTPWRKDAKVRGSQPTECCRRRRRPRHRRIRRCYVPPSSSSSFHIYIYYMYMYIYIERERELKHAFLLLTCKLHVSDCYKLSLTGNHLSNNILMTLTGKPPVNRRK